MIIQSKRVWIAEMFVACQIEVAEGKIKAINKYGEKPVDYDFNDLRIIPGFIDVHTHGAYGYDANIPDPEGLKDWAKRLPVDEGVTSFLPATVTQSEEVLTKAAANIAAVMKTDYVGAEILGIHFEGPYLNKANKGAQPEEYIVIADVEQFKAYQKAAEGNIKYITLAAENDEDHRLTKYLKETGVAVSIGHAGASFDEMVRAYGNGACCITHVHNGMPVYHHRNPAVVGAAYRLRSMYGEMVCDLNHVDPVVINNYFTIKGDYAIMVSDSLIAKGFPKGIYQLGGHDIEIRDNGSAYLAGTDTLAGSTLGMNIGLKNLVEACDLPFKNALKACTINPARMLRIDNRKGEIIVNNDADLVVLTEDYGIKQSFCKGRAQK